jgi:hypothetical protein
MTRRFTPFLLVSMLLAGFTAGALLSGPVRERTAAGAQTSSQSRPAITAPGPPSAATLPDFSRIAERTVPAVVNISAQQVVRRQFYDPFDSLFGRPDVFSSRGVQNSLGSGVVVSADGFVLTNYHVVTGESRRVTIEQVDVTALSDKRGCARSRGLRLGHRPHCSRSRRRSDDMRRFLAPEGCRMGGVIGNALNSARRSLRHRLGRRALAARRLGQDFIQTVLRSAATPAGARGTRSELVGISTFIYGQVAAIRHRPRGIWQSGARIVSDLRQCEVRRGTSARAR